MSVWYNQLNINSHIHDSEFHTPNLTAEKKDQLPQRKRDNIAKKRWILFVRDKVRDVDIL